MLSGVAPMALATIGTAVFRIVVSSDSMKNATATSHGSTRRMAGNGAGAVRAGVATLSAKSLGQSRRYVLWTHEQEARGACCGQAGNVCEHSIKTGISLVTLERCARRSSRSGRIFNTRRPSEDAG